MDRLAAMQTFVRVVERGSFSAVAREANATQSTISKQVAALERALGARLLSRTTRSLALTEEGERYFEEARRLVAEVAEAENALRRGARQLSGWLRVAASVGVGRRVLMPLVQRFLAAHPEVRIDLRLNDGLVDLVEQGIDVALRVGELRDSSLLARRVGFAKRVLVAHRHYLRTLPPGLGAPRRPEDLTQHDCIVYTELSTRNSWSFTAGPGAAVPPGTTRSVAVQGRLKTNSSEVVRAAVLASMGVGYGPTWLFEPELANGELQCLLPDWTAQPIPMHLVSPRERRDSAKVRAFGDHIAGALRAL